MVSLGLLIRQRHISQNYIMALEEASSFIGNGLIVFDHHDHFINANEQAFDFLSGLFVDGEGQGEAHKLFLPDFLDYFYDHAVDCDESLLNTLGRSAEKLNGVGFREVIMASQSRLCLVEVQKTPNGGSNLILIDVDDAKSQEERMLRLGQYNYELNQAIQATTSGVVITKPQGGKHHVAVFANKAFCEIFDIKHEDVVGKNVNDLFERTGDKKSLRKIPAIGEINETDTVELNFKNSKNEERWYDLKFTPVKDHKGKLDLFIGILSDTTELKVREAEFSKAQRLEALGQLSAGVAHDFNNVLSIIDGYTRLTRSAVNDNPNATEYLERIQTAAQRGASLIKQMLTFSRHEIVQNVVIDLGAVLQEQKTLLVPLLDASIKFEVLNDAQDMYVECPADNMTQILMNLVVNARDAMPHGGTLLVEVRACPPETLPKALQEKNPGQAFARLVVSDTGMGMDKDVVDRIFDPFFTTKDQGKGTGLGLSMVYGMVKQIGGRIDVDSTLGRGTSFSIYLPLTDKRPSKKISGNIDDLSAIRFDGYTTLLAEDEPDLLLLVGDMLEKLGMTVLKAKDGNEALVLQDEFEGPIDLLLTDVVMPELGGVDLADLISELHPKTNIIFMSGYPASGQMARIEMSEDSELIAKPIKYDDLVKIIYSKLHGGEEPSKISGVETPRWATKENPSDKQGAV